MIAPKGCRNKIMFQTVLQCRPFPSNDRRKLLGRNASQTRTAQTNHEVKYRNWL